MTGHESRISPVSVAAAPGAEREKLLQRFAELDARNQSRVLEMTLTLIHQQQDEQLPQRDRSIKHHTATVDRLLELIETQGHKDVIQTRMWWSMLADHQQRLIELDVDYFGIPDRSSPFLPSGFA